MSESLLKVATKTDENIAMPILSDPNGKIYRGWDRKIYTLYEGALYNRGDTVVVNNSFSLKNVSTYSFRFINKTTGPVVLRFYDDINNTNYAITDEAGSMQTITIPYTSSRYESRPIIITPEDYAFLSYLYNLRIVIDTTNIPLTSAPSANNFFIYIVTMG